MPKIRREIRLLLNRLKNRKYRGFEIEMITFLEKEGYNYLYEPDRFSIEVLKKVSYIPDLRIESSTNSDSDIYLELKGRLTNENRKKYLAIKQQYPEMDLRFVFQRPENRIRKGSKTTYAEWAEKNGFKWCSKAIPKEWLKEMSYR